MQISKTDKISISEPCPEKWGNMQSREDGRWCSVCELTVTDFTKMSNRQIADYLAEKNGAQVCGRCRVDQVESKSRWPRWMASALIFIFGVGLISSCMPRKHGRMKMPSDSKKGMHHQTETHAG